MSKCISKEEEEREERLKEEKVKFERSIESLKSQKDIAAIVSGMKLHTTHAGIQEKAGEAVLALMPCVEMEEWRKVRDEKGDALDSVMAKYAEFAKLGVIEHLIQVLSLHKQMTSAVISTCKIIHCISRNADNRVLIAKEGGIPLILAALDNHAKHAGVVEQACWALYNIGWSDKTVQKSIKDAGASKLVRAAVARLDATADTKKYGQMLLDKLAQL